MNTGPAHPPQPTEVAAIPSSPAWATVLRVALPAVFLSAASLLGLLHSYVWFHTVAELVSIVIAFTALAVALSARDFTRNHFVICIAVGLGWAAGLDVAHTLLYRGMRIVENDTANIPTQLWVAARALQAVALLVSPFFLRRRAHAGALFAGFGLVAIACTAAIATGAFPDAFVEGRGLTPFKVHAEHAIIAVLVAALVLLWRSRALMSTRLLATMTASSVFMIVSEFYFTQYASAYGTANLVGHLAKIVAFWLVFEALVQSTLREPFGMLARAASTYDAVPEPTLIMLADGTIQQANRAAGQRVGEPPENLVGRASHALFHDPALAPADCPVCASLPTGEEGRTGEIALSGGERVVECTVAPFRWAGEPAFVQVIRDVTRDRRQAEAVAFAARRDGALLRLPGAAEQADEAAFLRFGLELAEELTGSRVAFLHLVSDDERTLDCVAWTGRARETESRHAAMPPCALAEAGPWADGVRRRAPVILDGGLAADGFRGLPASDTPPARLASVPVIDGGRVRLLAGVGDKPAAYTDRDVETLQLIASETWRLVSRRRTELKLATSEANLRALVDAMPEVVWLKDARGAVLLCNPVFERLFGVTQAGMVGKSSRDIVDDETAQAFDAHDRVAITAGRPMTNEEWVTDAATGERRLFETIKTPVRAPDGALLGVLGVSRDVTDRRRAEAEQRRMALELGERVKEMRCLYELSQVLDEPSLDEGRMLAAAVPLLPPAFLHPTRMRAAIRSTWGHFGDTARVPAGPSLERVLRVNGGQVGTIRVFYGDTAAVEGEPFLADESRLMDTVARLLGRALERHHAASRVRRLTYLYNTLSATNRNIVHARGRDALFAGLGSALGAQSEFPLFFIALAGEPASGLRLQHTFGIPDDRLPRLAAMLADAGHPFAAALAEASRGSVVAGEITPDPAPGSWDEHLHEQGVHSRAILPFRSDQQLVGVAVLYAKDHIDFDDEQLALLGEMAEDMSFALTIQASEDRRKAAEERAAMSEHRFREVFDASPLPMLIIALATDEIRAVNRALLAWTGYAREDLSRRDAWYERVYPDPTLRAEMRARWHEATKVAQAAGGVHRSPEVRLRARDGTVRVAVATLTVLGGDAIVVWEDLTALREGEAALRENERRFRDMVENSVTGIYVSRYGKVAYANPRACAILGWSDEELAGRDILDLAITDPESRERLRRAQDAVLAGKPGASMRVAARRRDGVAVELDLHANQAPWDGAPALLVMIQDITERARSERQIADYVRQLEGAMRTTLNAISHMVELRDPYTAGHERRVGLIAGAIAREMGWDEARAEFLEMAGLVHDIGKISVPAEILAKPNRLSRVEMEIVKGHAEAGYEILKDVSFPQPVAEIIRQHHERPDGSGYPRGLRGEEILPEARVLAVADVVEAMASHRPYRPALGLDAALAEIERGRGTAYDPVPADALLHLVREKGYRPPD